jgi:hypothetical protein
MKDIAICISISITFACAPNESNTINDRSEIADSNSAEEWIYFGEYAVKSGEYNPTRVDSLIELHSDSILFLNYWSYMSYDEFEQVSYKNFLDGTVYEDSTMLSGNEGSFFLFTDLVFEGISYPFRIWYDNSAINIQFNYNNMMPDGGDENIVIDAFLDKYSNHDYIEIVTFKYSDEIPHVERYYLEKERAILIEYLRPQGGRMYFQGQGFLAKNPKEREELGYYWFQKLMPNLSRQK